MHDTAINDCYGSVYVVLVNIIKKKSHGNTKKQIDLNCLDKIQIVDIFCGISYFFLHKNK